MAGSGYRIVFNDVKQKVGVDDIAYHLGYALDKKAGVGKYYELVLGNDRIVVRNAPKAQQSFFRRNGQRGDVVTLIRENLDSFNVSGKDEWTKVANVLAKFANMQPVEHYDRTVAAGSHTSLVFDPSRYKVVSVNTDKLPYLFSSRGFNGRCVSDFGDSVVMIRDNGNKNFTGYNVGFAYRRSDNNEVSGYEIRGGGGFKSKAAGTDSSHSFWSATFGCQRPEDVRNVYVFESAFDAMAFYQLNRVRLKDSFAVVSFGGQFSEAQVKGCRERFPMARFWDCFDNDLAGNVFSANLVKYLEKKDFNIANITCGDGSKITNLEYDGRKVSLPSESFSFKEAAKLAGMSYEMGHWKSPYNFKDWNDCLMNKPVSCLASNLKSKSKYERDENLAEKRKSSLKM